LELILFIIRNSQEFSQTRAT